MMMCTLRVHYILAHPALLPQCSFDSYIPAHPNINHRRPPQPRQIPFVAKDVTENGFDDSHPGRNRRQNDTHFGHFAIKTQYEQRAAVRREREKKRGEEKKRPKIKFEQMDVDFEEIEVLSLSFKNLSRIDNLNGLKTLTTLKLDNNIISTIENLDYLVNLTWLDLSFNNISKIIRA